MEDDKMGSLQNSIITTNFQTSQEETLDVETSLFSVAGKAERGKATAQPASRA